MTPERWAQIEELFHCAAECEPNQRPSLLDGACNGDEELRRAVEVLLASEESARDDMRVAVHNGLEAVTFPLVGETVSHYRILDGLGGGGMGLVYRAEDIKLGRQVALKFLPEESALDPAALGRFEREARSASALEHPNICPVYEFGEHEGQPFLVMQLLEGQTLRELISAAGPGKPPFTIGKLLDLAIQITGGLEAAHGRGIIHRDIKPANIFVAAQGQAKILDFGLAKLSRGEIAQEESKTLAQEFETERRDTTRTATLATPDPRLSRTGVAMGTAGYMSPEQARGEKLDARTDLFSFGLVLYEMATGQRAFNGDTGPVLHDAILRSKPAPVRELNPHATAKLETILQKALEKDREARYQSASALRADLEALKRGLESSSRARWRELTAGVAAAVLLAGVGTFAWLNRSFPPPRVLSTTQVTHDGFDKVNSLTDGSRLYITESTGSRQFLVQVSVGGGETSIIPTPFNIAISDISPDHSRLLVANAVGTEGDGQVWVLPLPTGAPRRLGDVVAHWGVESPGWAVWSPDGRSIAFTRNSKIYLSDADGANIRELVALSGPASEICFSPDGTRLRFTVWSRRDSPLIWEVGSDGTNLHPVFPKWQSPPAEIAGAWSRDGRYYFFTTCHSDSCSIWATRERAGLLHNRTLPPVQLTTSPTPVFLNGVSPDGKIVYGGTWSSQGELVRYDAWSRQFAPFLGGIFASDLDFSRDGKWVAYVSGPDRTLWRSRLDGSERLQLTAPPALPALPRWSPDGAQIAYVDEHGGPYCKILLISAQGGTPQELISEHRNLLDPSWSPDGKQLVFGRVPQLDGSAGKISIQILDLRSKQVATIPGSEDLFCPRWSPDGQHMAAMSADRKKLVLFNFKTKEWADWTNEPGTIGYPAWSRDGRYIYYESGSTSNPTYRRINIRQTRSEFLIDLKGLKRGIPSGIPYFLGPWSGIAPDASPLFSRDSGTAEIYALKLELP